MDKGNSIVLVKIAHQNRIKTQEPRGKSGWCRGCDMARVRDGQKCPVCGHKETNRAKKPSEQCLQ